MAGDGRAPAVADEQRLAALLERQDEIHRAGDAFVERERRAAADGDFDLLEHPREPGQVTGRARSGDGAVGFHASILLMCGCYFSSASTCLSSGAFSMKR